MRWVLALPGWGTGWVAGVTWQITPETLDAMLNDPDKAKAERVMNAMTGMVKLDIAPAARAAGFRSLWSLTLRWVGDRNKLQVLRFAQDDNWRN